MKLRTRIFLFFAPVMILSISGVSFLHYFQAKSAMQEEAENELKSMVITMHRASEELLTNSIKNFLRGHASRIIQDIEVLEDKVQQGLLTRKEAKDILQERLKQIVIGKSGYIVALNLQDEKIILDIHPFLKGTDCSKLVSCQGWKAQKSGYNTYDWKNPKDNIQREKVSYLIEYKPWNWIMGVTSYKDEFKDLLKLEDLEGFIVSSKIAYSGYFFVFNENRETLIHPALVDGSLPYFRRDSTKKLLKFFMENEGTFVDYSWKNPKEDREQKKIGLVKKLDAFGLYLGATVYYNEVHILSARLLKTTLYIFIIASALLMIIVYFFSKRVSSPLEEIQKNLIEYRHTKKPFKFTEKSIFEIQSLGTTFEELSSALGHNFSELEQKIKELDFSRKEKEKSETLLSHIIDAMPSSIVVVDNRHLVVLWNDKAEELTGIKTGDAIGRPLIEVMPWMKEEQNTLQSCFEQKTIKTQDRLPITLDSEKSYFDLTFYPLSVKDLEGIVIRLDNTTGKVHMEDVMIQSEKMLSIGGLAAGMAHEINNPLAAMMLTVDVLRKRLTPDITANREAAERIGIDLEKLGTYMQERKINGALDAIKDTGSRAAKIVSNMLTFARKSQGVKEGCNFIELIEQTLELAENDYSLKSNYDFKKIQIIKDLSPAKKNLVCESAMIQQVILNLIKNSAEAMSEKKGEDYTPTLKIRAYEQNEMQILEVEDNGTGISEENKKRIFEPFYTTKPVGKGTGLGMSVSYFIVVDTHKGQMMVESVEGKYTLFTVSLPLDSEIITTDAL